MESGQYDNASVHEPDSETNQGRIPSDIMIRRLKNRERQRRYRARKRLEAEAKRAPTSLLLEHHGADITRAHTSTPLPPDTHVVPQTKKTDTKDQSAPLSMANEITINGAALGFASRVHCRRDWKKDARRVHLCKDQAVRSKDHLASEQTVVHGNQMPSSFSQVNVNPPTVTGVQSSASLLDNDGTRKAVPGRRHWKAEARNKKG